MASSGTPGSSLARKTSSVTEGSAGRAGHSTENGTESPVFENLARCGSDFLEVVFLAPRGVNELCPFNSEPSCSSDAFLFFEPG